ncbi:AAA family ATPase [Sulfuriferula nivalis]|uniref:AAA+ ATPase domain-containing protein n=1 Tax=Sulfuriferula nivalis TaxID=2675298 RepID=A0A809RHF4_9PROT|nr:ATP-binding protein [Sulfuriferula nivalis]BBP01056.1 hypothetical protein SFSGTM_17640 [Sulfuriferula nivalis]
MKLDIQKNKSTFTDNLNKELKHLWLLRIILKLEAHKRFLNEHAFRFDDIARELGLDNYVDNPRAYNRDLILTELRQNLATIEKHPPQAKSESRLWENLGMLGQALKLNDIEILILFFAIAVKTEDHFEEAIDSMGNLNIASIEKIFSICLGIGITDVRTALSESGTLFRTGILWLDMDSVYTFSNTVVIMHGLTTELMREQNEPLSLFHNHIVPSFKAKLGAEHYSHLTEDTATIKHYLGAAGQAKNTGINILIYGAPGSGKTEYARMIAEVTGHHLYEIATETRQAKALEGSERFRAFRLAQTILERRHDTLILFDEIEDVFKESLSKSGKRDNQSGTKAWVNRLLETNPVPSFWLTNNLPQLDPAVVRRFDYILEMNAPPRSVRARMLDDYLIDLPISTHWKRQMSEHENLVPAVIERAAKVVRHIKHTIPTQEMDKVISRVMGNTLEALYLPRMPKASLGMDTNYRLEILNADCNVGEICDNLVTEKRGRLCLYGPPGTGKSAFGRYIADRMDRPLLIKRASDILSPFLGEAEINMAKMFREAEIENAVLLLDEADTYLQDRKNAQRSWEISEVNEMLTQMESFDGVFIASTNLMSSLDPAALRRFDLKLRFDYLKPEQAWLMFTDTIAKLGLPLDESLQKSVAALAMLTPGDFATVSRQARLRKITDDADLLSRLTDECALKPDANKRAIGFSSY